MISFDKSWKKNDKKLPKYFRLSKKMYILSEFFIFFYVSAFLFFEFVGIFLDFSLFLFFFAFHFCKFWQFGLARRDYLPWLNSASRGLLGSLRIGLSRVKPGSNISKLDHLKVGTTKIDPSQSGSSEQVGPIYLWSVCPTGLQISGHRVWSNFFG